MSNTNPKASDFARMKAMYGENKLITGDYDKNLAVSCSNGTFVGKEKDSVLIYKGIPFAKPPVGEFRWKAPASAEESDEVREAYYFGKSPIQQPWYSELASCYPNSEDCLYLNVWTNKDGGDKKAVMVFIHGGAYGYGGTSDPLYDGFNYVNDHPDIVLVTIAYRVGVMGFIDFSMIEGSEGYEDSVNLGLLDQVEALRWINKNIEGFGGDPDNITIFGESAGGGSVSILPVMPIAKGLFKRVIAQSGSIALTYSREEAAYFTKLFSEKTGAKTMQDFLSLTEEEIYKANLPINEKNNFPVRDGRIVPEDLYACYEAGDSAWVDMIAGTNKDECRYWIGEMGGVGNYAASIPVLFENQLMLFSDEDKEKAREYYNHGQGAAYWRLTEFENDIAFRVPAQQQLLLHAKNGGKAYHYFWTFPSALKNRGACHAVELSSVFNNLDEKIYTGDNINIKLAMQVQDMWANFAKTGDPSTDRYHWPLYNEEYKQTLVLGEDIHIKENLYSRRTAIIKDLLKYKISGNYAELSLKVPYVKIMISILVAILVLIIVLLIILL